MLGLSGFYQNRIDNEFERNAAMAAKAVAGIVSGESIDRYHNTLQKDDEYTRILDFMRLIRSEPDIMFVYIVKYTDGGRYFIFDADIHDTGEMDLGYYESWDDIKEGTSFEFYSRLLNGERVEREISNTHWGWLLTMYEPIYREDGSVAAYSCADISMSDILKERQSISTTIAFTILICFSLTIIITANLN